jgi:3-dehydroquinate synthase
MDHIYLYGPPGSGKSSVGRILAENLNTEFVDLDEKIEEIADAPIPQIMEDWGESGFRDIETTALKRVSKGRSKVVSLGGGALLRAQNRTFAESRGQVICFDADLQTLLERLRADPTMRPLLAGHLETELFRLLDQRRAHYESFELRHKVDNKTAVDVARELQLKLGRYYVRGMGQGYDVMIQHASYERLADLLRMSGLGPPVALVCDETVAPLYGDVLMTALRRSGYGYNRPHMITIPPGEGHKNLESIMKFWRRFLEAGLDRKSTVIALGGGVIGDLAGFAASTFMRGVSWVNIPTTLLAMVDSSLGGKTGFDLPQGKNLIGTFFPPRLVLANPYLLATLPVRELRCGLAEVVKHGIIADPTLFQLCQHPLPEVKSNLLEIVRRAMAVKIQVIEADPYERGLRASLNLGHTLGHAVESASNFRLKHGEAIAIGLVAEARLAERMGIAKKGLAGHIAQTLTGLGLPVEIPPTILRESIVRFMRMDKKREKGVVKFALPVDIGKVQVGVAVEDLNLVFGENP